MNKQSRRTLRKPATTPDRQAAARNAHWFLTGILPYRSLDNVIDGVGVTFTDITASKILEAELRKTQTGLEQRVVEQGLKLERTEEELRAELLHRQDADDRSGPAPGKAGTP